MTRLLAAALLVYLLGLALFASTLPRPASNALRTDGIVVLTGGSGRLRRGLTLLQAGRAQRLLVSGVDRAVGAEDIARTFDVPRALFTRIDLGHESVDTRSNGDEAGRWIARHHYRSIRLVTTDWHMRRALLELARSIPPGVAVLPDGLESEPGLVALVREYNKYLLRLGASLAERGRGAASGVAGLWHRRSAG